MTHDAVKIENAGDLRQRWFQVDELGRGLFSILEPLHEEHVRSYLVVGDERGLLIDTGMGVGDIRAVVEELTSLPVSVVNSHSHWDHIGGNHRFAEISIHQAEAHRLPDGVGNERLRKWFAPDHLLGPLPESFDLETFAIAPSVADALLSGGEHFELGGRTLDVIHAPGHSPGGIVLLDRRNRALFSTDVAYAGALYGFGSDANFADYRTTLASLAELAAIVENVYPSHNASPISPALLPAMRDGIEAIAAGKEPDRVEDEKAIHRFAGFSIAVDSDDRRAESQ